MQILAGSVTSLGETIHIFYLKHQFSGETISLVFDGYPRVPDLKILQHLVTP